MDNPRAEKVAVVDEVRGHFDGADASILTEYRGLKVKDLAELRRSLRPAGAEYKIYKNTLVRLAAKDVGLAELDPMLTGPTAIAFVSGDAAAAAKALRDFSLTHPLLVIKGGVLGEKVIDAKETTALAELPSREVLLARLAGGFAAPLQQLAGLLQALPRNLAYGLKALADQKAAEGDAAPADVAAADAPAADAEAPAEAASAEAPSAEAEAPAPADEAPAAEPTDAPTTDTDSQPQE